MHDRRPGKDERCEQWLDSCYSDPDSIVSAQDSLLEKSGSRKRAAVAMEDQEQPTPRAKRRASRVPRAPEGRAEDEQTDDDSQASSSKVSKTSRNSSPTKAVNRLQGLDAPVNYRSIMSGDIFPEHIKRLIDAVRSFAKGIAIAPLSLRHSWQDLQLEHAFYSPDSDRAKLGSEPTSSRIDEIAEDAIECQLREDHEAGWNSAVHGPLLNLARFLSSHRRSLGTVNLVLARPMDRHRPFGLPGKMVDFGIVLKPSPLLNTVYRRLDREWDGTRYWNHTAYDPIAMMPLAVSIETKRPGEGWLAGKHQLMSWHSAHFSRLAELCQQPQVSSPLRETVYLPSIFATGPVYSFLLAAGYYDDSGKLEQTTVYSPIMLGDVTSTDGVLQVLSTLLQIMDWCQITYRPWFEERVASRPSAERAG